MDNDYIVQLITKLDGSKTADDLKKIEQQLNAKGINIKTSLDTATSKQELQNLAKQLQSVLKSSGINIDTSKIMSAFNQVSREAQNVANQINKIQLSFDNGHGDSEYKNRIQSLVNDFEKYGLSVDEANKKTANLRTILEGFKVDGNFLPDDQLVAQANKLEAEFKAVKVSLDSAKLSFDKFLQPVSSEKASSLIVRINSFLTKNTAITAEAKEELQSFVAQINNGVNLNDWNKFNSRLKEIENEMRQAGKLGKSLTQTFKDSAKSFIEWTTASGAVMEIWTAVRQGVGELKDLDSILTEISKTSDLTKNQLKELGDTAFESASKYGESASTYLTSIQEMYRAGFDNAEETAELVTLAKKAGDMETTSSVDYVTATNAAYDYKGSVEDLTRVLDGQNYITNNAAISMQDMADATSEAASIASQYGVEVNELSALIAVAVSKTRESGAEVGTALKALFVNLQDTTSAPIKAAFDAVGISMTKMVNGSEQLKTPIELIKELSVAFNSLPEGDIKRANILNDIGGKHHANTLSSILSDLTAYEEMLDLYSQGMGSAAREAEKSANDWTGSWEKVKNSTNDLIQNFANTDVIVGFLNVLNGVIKAFDELSAVGTTLVGGGALALFRNVDYLKMPVCPHHI